MAGEAVMLSGRKRFVHASAIYIVCERNSSLSEEGYRWMSEI